MRLSNRRDFLKNIAAGGAVIGAGLTAAGCPDNRVVKKATIGDHEMRYRNLGSTGFQVSEVGFGAMNTRNAELIHAAIDSGINYIDTAHGYMRGENERIVGRVMKTKRDKVFLATKVHAKGKSADKVREMMELSLKRLDVENVDCMLMHMPDTREEFLVEEHLKAFEQARKDGICRFIGVSSHKNQADILDAVVESKIWDSVLVSYNYHSPKSIAEAVARARRAGLAIIAMKTQKPCNKSGFPEHGEDVTPNQAALMWVLNDPNVDTTIPGMTSFEQLAEDLGVMDLELGFNDRSNLYKYSRASDATECRGVSGCTGCRDQCPKGVDICELNRCIGYADGYNDLRLARENYDALNPEWHVDVCDGCEECEVKCVHGLNLTETVRRARELFA